MDSYKNLKIKYSYDTGNDNLIEDFYIPLLENAKRYDRITGFFSSSSLALAARGIAGLIRNHGTMRLVCCPRLSKEDVAMMKSAVNEEEAVIKRLSSDLCSLEDEFEKNHVAALGWMLANGYLEIKIALIKNKFGYMPETQISGHPIIHQKVGILYDNDFDAISFSGSNNESASGWLYNLEEFKVFKSWEPGQKQYYADDRKKFDNLWNNMYSDVIVKSLPEAIREKLITVGKEFHQESLILENYRKALSQKKTYRKPKEQLRLFFYQEEAVQQWLKCGKTILLQMVTGSGKTRTAIGCMAELLKTEKDPLLFIIACPQTTLSTQWRADINRLDIPINDDLICDGTASKWREKLESDLLELATGLYDSLVVYTTHTTCSSKDFIDIIQRYANWVTKVFIGDEVHGMGSPQHKMGLLDTYQYRIGCSATPSRWFDDAGTKTVLEYFHNNVYQFTIEDALTKFNPVTNKHFLVNYKYHPKFISMTEKELEDYKKLTLKILRTKKTDDPDSLRQRLLFKRADLEKNAENKYEALEEILDEIGPDIGDTIIFVSDEQIGNVIHILSRRGVVAHEFTMKQSAKPSDKYGGVSERDYLIKKFKEGDYQVLVAIKCLDEGIDIPSARRAIIMASSTNPREYVQRIGRIIRQAEGKQNAELYDMIIKPDFNSFKNEDLENFEKHIFEAELRRVRDLSQNAINNVDVAIEIMKVEESCHD